MANKKNFEICMLGTYDPYMPVKKLRELKPTMEILQSKQKPRKLRLESEDGEIKTFILKSKEDLKQDERTMQLFSLVNSLLANDKIESHKNLSIQRYSITPLSSGKRNAVGLIGWANNCTTFHTLVKLYRENCERRDVGYETTYNGRYLISSQFFEKLQAQSQLHDTEESIRLAFLAKASSLQTLAMFMNTRRMSSGSDLAHILRLKSVTCDTWLERRTNYTRSLAVTSMVGYILGLGDRHPSNIMLNEKSGKIVHIDFGDCFELSFCRPSYPEKIPFRLTRMMVKAVEITGVRGTYRNTCINVLKILRKNQNTLKSLLSAFIHDPLSVWQDESMAKSNTRPNENQNDEDQWSPENSEFSEEEEYDKLEEFDPLTYGRGFTFTAPTRHSYKKSFMQHWDGLNKKQEDSNKREDWVADSKIKRVQQKLTGRDDIIERGDGRVMTVEEQVDALIEEATDPENLSSLFSGWCAFW